MKAKKRGIYSCFENDLLNYIHDDIPEDKKKLYKSIIIKESQYYIDYNGRLDEKIQITLPQAIYKIFVESNNNNEELGHWHITSEKNTIEYIIPLKRSNLKITHSFAFGDYRTLYYTKNSFVKKIVLEFLENNNLKKEIKYNNFNDLLKIIDNTNFDYFDIFHIEIILYGPQLTKTQQDFIQEKLGNINITFKEKEASNENEVINNIIDKIYAMLDTGIFEDKDKIKKHIEELISNYNNKIKSIDNDNFLYHYEKLKLDLEVILEKLSRKINNKNEHIKMLILLNSCMSIIENVDEKNIKEIYPQNDLELYIWRIVKDILPHINNKSKLEELKSIINNERNKIISYIKGDNNSKAKEYKSCENFILIFRKKIQNYLYSLKMELNNQDSIKDFIKTFPQIIKNEQIKNKNEEIDFLMKEIQKNSQIIQKNGTKKDFQDLQRKLKEIEINENDDINKTISNITEILKYTFKILLRIEKREQQNNKIDKYTINIRK